MAVQKEKRLASAHLLLDAVERKIASESGREALREFLRALMHNRHLRFLGEELASAAYIVHGNCSLCNWYVVLAVYMSQHNYYKIKQKSNMFSPKLLS